MRTAKNFLGLLALGQSYCPPGCLLARSFRRWRFLAFWNRFRFSVFRFRFFGTVSAWILILFLAAAWGPGQAGAAFDYRLGDSPPGGRTGATLKGRPEDNRVIGGHEAPAPGPVRAGDSSFSTVGLDASGQLYLGSAYQAVEAGTVAARGHADLTPSAEFVTQPRNPVGWGQEQPMRVPPVPEPTTLLAGALLLLPFAASTLRFVRRNHA